MLKVYKLDTAVETPSFQTEGSACFDIKAHFKEGQKIKTFNHWNKELEFGSKVINGEVCIQIYPSHRALIPTGIIFGIPDKHVLKMYVRSSVALKKGLVLANGVGIIDSDYTHETFVMLKNTTDGVINLPTGTRIAQCSLEKCLDYDIEETMTHPAEKSEESPIVVEEIVEKTTPKKKGSPGRPPKKREGGFGSTGEK